jgi:hypothetical protein
MNTVDEVITVVSAIEASATMRTSGATERRKSNSLPVVWGWPEKTVTGCQRPIGLF